MTDHEHSLRREIDPAAQIVAPWSKGGELVSLWDIMRKYLQPYANHIALIVTRLMAFENEIGVKRQMRGGTDFALDDELKNRIREWAERAFHFARWLNLAITPRKANAIGASVTSTMPVLAFPMQMRISDLRETLVQELESRWFLTAGPDIIVYFDKKLPYGKVVADVFPDCSEDIDEAHQCFAFGRYTAVAFHISRAMEAAVRQVAKKMRAKAPRDEWQAYINAMDEAIKKMPFKTVKHKAKRALYSEASGYLFNFKEAFRNKTMHPKKTYTRKQALKVIESAGDFLSYVSEQIFRGRLQKP